MKRKRINLRKGGRVATIARAAGAALLVLGAAGLGQRTASAQTPVGSAAGLQVSLLSLVSLNFAQTNPLPASGAQQSASVASVNALAGQGYVTTGLITASTQGSPLNAVTNVLSSASVDGLNLFPPLALGNSLLTADTVSSTTTAGLFSSALGSTTITNLFFNGNSITVDGSVNQTVTVAGVAKLVINEQIQNGNSLTTNALHLTVLSGINAGDVIVSQSVAGFSGPAAAAPEPGAGALMLAFGPVLPALVVRTRRKRLTAKRAMDVA